IPAWNEAERIADCLTNATRQTMAPHEVIVVNNNSTDDTVEIVNRFIADNPQANVKLMSQSDEQGLIPTRNYGLNHATGDIVGRIDADTMLKPDWVEVVSGIFTEDSDAMGATGPVVYYDMPAKHFSLRGDNQIRQRVFRADGQTLLFGSNMALRRSAWTVVAGEVCRDKADVMHEDLDISLHMMGHDMKTVYSPRMIAGMSARRMDTSLPSFLRYMKRFKNTFDAHPQHSRTSKPEYIFTALYPILHAWFPVYQKYLQMRDVNPAERVWIKEQMQLIEEDKLEDFSTYENVEAIENDIATQEPAEESAQMPEQEPAEKSEQTPTE
ncbi:MAG: glycosyltransferase, partial [Bifidobacteriaceae bacterium]|nr:glycosyltransferase [Bifidobacteriaceae bacterium]